MIAANRTIGLLATMVELLGLLKPFWLPAVLATVLGLVSGSAAVALLARINSALGAGDIGTPYALLAIIGLVAATLGTAFASEVGNTIVGQRVVAALRRKLCRQIVDAPLEQVERVTPHRLTAVLTGDLEALSAATLNMAPLAVAAATVIGVFAILAWQSPTFISDRRCGTDLGRCRQRAGASGRHA